MCLAIPGEVKWVGSAAAGALPGEVDLGGTVREVNLVMVPEVAPGDHVIVHSGFAIRRLSPEEAKRARALLEELPKMANRSGR